MRSFRLIALVAAVAASSTFSFYVQAEPLKLRMDWQILPGHLPPLIARVSAYAPGVFRYYGKSYVVEPMRLVGGGPTLTALLANQIELSGAFSAQQLVMATIEAKQDLKVIAQALTTELPGYKMTNFWVRKNEIKRIEDLKGKVIAISARGGNLDAAVRILLGRAGLQQPRDYQLAEVRLPAMVAALESKRVDAAPMVPPFDRLLARNPDFAPLFSVGDAFGPVETLMFAGKAEFVAKNRAALVDFLEDNIRMRRWMTEPNTRIAAINLVSEISKVPAAELATWVYTNDDYYYHPQALVNTERLQQNVNTMKAGGIVSEAIDVRPYVDMSLAIEAGARIKD